MAALLLLLWLLGEGVKEDSATERSTAALSIGQIYPIKRAFPACPVQADLHRTLELQVSGDNRATAMFMLAHDCAMPDVGTSFYLDGYGSLGIVRIRKQGEAAVLYTVREAIQ